MTSDIEVSRFFESAGGYSYEISGTEPARDIFKTLWGLATDFAAVNSAVPVVTLASGKDKKQRAKKRIDEFPVLKQVVTGGFWVDKWPGTTSSTPPRLLVTGNAREVDLDDFFVGSTSLLWRASGCWDDLMLLSRDKLLFYVCTHEGFGQIIGNRELFIGLELDAVQVPSRKWEVRGRKIDSGLQEELFG